MSSDRASRNLGWVRTLIERFVRPELDYRTPSRATVVQQNADGSLDVRPTGGRLPELVKIPMRGLFGVTHEPKAGAVVLIAFEDGDPQRPLVIACETTRPTSTTIAAETVVIDADSILLGKLASLGVVRVGDFGTFTGTSASGPVTGTFQMATGSSRVLSE